MRSEKNIKFVALAVLLVMALVAALPLWLHQVAESLLAATRQENLKQQRLELVLDSLRDAETAQRGFIITGNDTFLQPYREAEQALAQALRDAGDKARGDAEQATVRRIARLADLKLADLDKVMFVRRSEGFASAEREVSSMRGKLYMDELRRLIGAELERTRQRRDELRAELLDASSRSFHFGVIATVFNVGVLAALLAVVVRMLRQRRESARELEEKAAQLASAVEQASGHNRELRLTAEMLRAIDALPVAADSGPAVARCFSRLLPEVAGSFFLAREGGASLQRLVQWGEASEQPPEIGLDDCFALRRGSRYKVTGYTQPCCPHACKTGEAQVRICIPLVTHDELAGMIHLEGLAVDPEAQERQERIAVTVGEQLALALGSSMLRESLRRQSVLDPLTGLFNRRYFDETLKRELLRARRKGQPVSLVVLDLDRFKDVNDTYGHAAGDAVLRAVAGLVLQSIRNCDAACRYGGEELVILMQECSAFDAAARAENLRAAIEAAAPAPDGNGPRQVTASFGVAEYPLHAHEAEALFEAADKALYQAKQRGRNRVVTAAHIDMRKML